MTRSLSHSTDQARSSPRLTCMTDHVGSATQSACVTAPNARSKGAPAHMHAVGRPLPITCIRQQGWRNMPTLAFVTGILLGGKAGVLLALYVHGMGGSALS